MTHIKPSVIGIDISKADFVVAEHNTPKTRTCLNSPTGWKEFYKTLKCPEDTFVVMEVTGGYEMGLLDFLCDHDVTCHRADTVKSKRFIQSRRSYGKSDKLDAQELARYGYERQDELRVFRPNSKILQELKALTLRRNDLTKARAAEKNRLQAPGSACVQKSIKAMLRSLEREIKKLESRINEIIAADKELREKREILQEIPGVGNITSLGFLSLMPELGYITRERAAALAGVAPYENDSGTKQGYRCIRGGRREFRSLLFMAAFAAIRSKSRLGAFYNRLRERGKRPMVALTALMRKILVIANAKMKEYVASQAASQTV